MVIPRVARLCSVVLGSVAIGLLTVGANLVSEAVAYAQTSQGSCSPSCTPTAPPCGPLGNCSNGNKVCAAKPGHTCPVKCTCQTNARGTRCRCP
jgi:hypothetical protein